MSVTLLIFLVLFLFFYFVQAGNFFIDGPAAVTFIWIRDCPGYKKLPIQFQIKIHKVNRTIQVIDVNGTLPFPIDNTVSVYMKSERWGAGGWMKNAFSMKEPNACSAFNTIVGNLWFDIQKKIGMVPRKCPLPMGNYYAKDIVIDLQKMTVQTFMYGRFKTLAKFLRGKQILFCKEFELELNEKLPYN